MGKSLMKKMALLVSVVLVCSLFLVGCAGSGANSGASPSTQETTSSVASAAVASNADDSAQPVVKDSIVYELFSAPNVLDPQMQNAPAENHLCFNIFDNLFRAIQHDFGRVEPWLVESYEISEDHTDWTLKLREGVLFHNGDEMTAEDVVFMLERSREAPVNIEAVKTLKNVSALDTYTVFIEQDMAYPIWPETFAGVTFGIPNKRLIEEHGVGAYEAIVGTGPYQIRQWDSDNTIIMDYFEDWFQHDEYEPQIKEVTFRVITDANAATIAFDSGEIDIFGRNILLSDFQRYRDDPNVSTFEVLQTGMRGLSMNNAEGQFTDVRLRRAINHAFDKEAINLLVAEGNYIAPIWTKIHSHAEGYDLAVEQDMIVKYEYNAEQAKALLAEAGYDEGNPLRTKMVSSTNTPMISLATAMQDYLAQVNVVAEVDSVEHAQYLQRVSTGDYECASAQWHFEPYWSPMIASVWTAYGSYYNYEQYNNPRVEEIVATVRGTWELEVREPLMAELIQLVTEDAVVAPIYHIVGMVATNGGLVAYPEPANLITSVFWMHY